LKIFDVQSKKTPSLSNRNLSFCFVTILYVLL
jgi:hypothetical protein